MAITDGTTRIAIVGVGGIFPGSPSLDDFWTIIRDRKDVSREVPPGRWTLDPATALASEPASIDRVSSTRAFFIEKFAFDPSGLDLDPGLTAQLDPMFSLALHAGRSAWLDTQTGSIDRKRVGVIIGNIALPTDSVSELAAATLGRTFEEKLLGSTSSRKPEHPLNRGVAGLPAGLLARGLGLGGGSYTLDAACASSLYALKLAADELLAGRADAMITGGLSRPSCLYTQMGFSQLRALSPSGRCGPFDRGANGLVVGEGSGMVVLKRLEDALKHGDKIYAVIAGIGLSNDVQGNLLAPSSEGQLRAMRAAYERADWKPTDIDLIECHATGTPVGDAVEFKSIRTLWGESGWQVGQCAIGSVKSNVGHTLTAAGSAGLIKVLLAMKHGTLPPGANFDAPAEGLPYDDSPFRVLDKAREWKRPSDRNRRAAISGFGFGGINAHVLIEEWDPESTTRTASRPRRHSPEPIAIVGMDAHIGPWKGLDAFRDRAFTGKDQSQPKSPHWWGLETSDWSNRQASIPGYYLDEIAVPVGTFRIPPKELADMLPQQLLMLEVAAGAIAGSKFRRDQLDRTGVFIGTGLDLNTTNFHLRWWLTSRAPDWARQLELNLDSAGLAQWIDELLVSIGPPLNANRTMGALGGVVASRIAREFHVGGPSFMVAGEEGSGLRALEVAVRSLQAIEIDQAIVGAVDLAGDIRSVFTTDQLRRFSRTGKSRPFADVSEGAVPTDGAVSLILKRRSDAVRDGDRIYALIKGVGAASSQGATGGVPGVEAYLAAVHQAWNDSGLDRSKIDYLEAHASGAPEEDSMERRVIEELWQTSDKPRRINALKASMGHTGAASSLASVVRASLALHEQQQPVGSIEAPTIASFQTSSKAHAWITNREEGPLHAGVSSIGLDGNCVHLVLEGDGATPPILSKAPQSNEGLFLLSGATLEAIQEQVARFQQSAERDRDQSVTDFAKTWRRANACDPSAQYHISLLAKDRTQLSDLIELSLGWLAIDPDSRPLRGEIPPFAVDRFFYSPAPLARSGELAFVFPGSGNHFPGMGRDYAERWPEVIVSQNQENARLLDQIRPEFFWERESLDDVTDQRTLIGGQVALGSIVADTLGLLGIRPTATIGYSLGESAALIAMRAWRGRDEMDRRLRESSLFATDLTGPCDAARKAWQLATDEPVDWAAGVVTCSAAKVREALKNHPHVYLLIINTLDECVLGGRRDELEDLLVHLGCPFYPLPNVSTVHCAIAREIEPAYRALHNLETTPPAGIRFYSCGSGQSYRPDADQAAAAIVSQAIDTLDFPRVIERAYADGVRLFVEIGPGFSCTRLIGQILGDRPHVARSACIQGQDCESSVLRLVAQLIAEGVVIDLTQLLGDDSPKPTISRNELVRVKIGGDAFAIPPSPERRVVTPIAPSVSPAIATLVVASQANIAPSVSPPAQASTTPMTTTMHQADPILAKVRTTVAANGEAHGAYLAFSSRLAEVIAGSLTNPPLTSQTLVPQVSPVLDPAVSTTRVPFNHDPAFMNREQCLNYAVGRIGDVLGSAFAPIDAYPTRVRLPDEPLMLVDRIMTVTGEPLSMTCGEVVTEHDILEDSWYLDANKIPICIAVEAGQADLFLSGYLGIDLQTHGLAVYRLLDARVTFHRELPGPGKIIHYEIQIERFFIHDDTYFFRFQFDATVDGELLLTMRDGCAGFFTDAALAAGKGVILTTLDRQAGPKIGQGWDALVPIGRESYSEAQIESLRQGDLTAAFGADFAHLPLARPLTIPGGRMKLIDRVLELEPSGGRHGLGFLRAEADIVPDAWFLTCHFVDDQVMPGTLMFECGQHALRVLLMRLGCVGEAGKVAWEPVPGRSSRLECRGQVTATTKKVHYDITIKELGYKPEPYAVADVIMYADGKAIVRVEGMAIQLSGTTRDELCAIWTHQADEPSPKALPLYDSSRILAYAIGKPSEGFGDRYTIFDEGRIIARLPGPPYLFVDRVMKLNGEPWVMNPGTTVQTEYDVPADAWYFQDDRNGLMPFAVLLEVALQPCGWLAAYMGSALLSPVDVHFRNLGGQAVLHVPVTSDIGTLTVQIKLTQASNSGGMILQHFDMHVLQGTRSIYKGTTYFGFFPDAALAQQVGIREATPYVPSPDEVARGIAFEYPAEAPFPDIMLRMVDQVTLYVPDGGPAGLGFIRGTKDVVASEWFFKAHFYQDPVCPGSLGLESFLQLLKVIAHERWSHGQVGLFESIASEAPHRWTYRGQILPTDRLVTIEAVVTKIDDERQRITADGFLSIDGRNIYQMNDFTIAYHTRVQ